MALITCKECGQKISSLAAACPGCGAPVETAGGKTHVIEATGKKWKTVQLIGMIVLVIGIFSCIASTRGPDGSYGVGVSIPWIGLAVYLFGRVSAWWHHG